MPRHGMVWLAIVVTISLSGPRSVANPLETPPLEATLALQKAMVMAKAYLRMDDAKKAVDVLELHLARVNGNSNYLELLRDAYRAYIKDLALKNQVAAAQRYLQRLVILDPNAANDPTLRPDPGPRFVPQAPKDNTPALPNFTATHGPSETSTVNGTPVARPESRPKVEVTPGAPKAPIIRAIRELPGDDPFDPTNQRVSKQRIAANVDQATQILARAHDEFARKRYSEARDNYEQVVRMDERALEQVRDRLAYCILDGAVENLNRAGNVSLDGIRKDVVRAIAMAPQLRATGDWLLNEIDQRGRTTVTGLTPDAVIDPPLNMQHFGKNPQGWMVTETTNFRIFHNQSRELVEKAALIAERTRSAMARKWFGTEGEPWSPKCELVLHATAADYARQTSVPATSPGHSRIETDPTSFRVIGRRIDLHTDTFGMLEAVLPHETTHVVLAGNFGSHQVPRWADEGVAVLTEPMEKIEQHRRNLVRGKNDGLLLPVRELMSLQNYPQAKQISAFYAQSVMLVEFLTHQRGPQVFTEFLRDGLQTSYDAALRKHYNWSFADLQNNWDEHVLGGRQAVASGR